MSRTDTTRRCELCGREVGTEFYCSDVGWLCAEHFLKAEYKYEPAISAYWELRALISEKDERIAALEAALKPFAFAAEYDPDVKISLNDEPLRIFTEDSDLHYETILSTRTAAPLTVGDLRTAYTALNPNKPPMPNGYDTSRTEFSTHSVETEMDEGSEGSSNE